MRLYGKACDNTASLRNLSSMWEDSREQHSELHRTSLPTGRRLSLTSSVLARTCHITLPPVDGRRLDQATPSKKSSARCSSNPAGVSHHYGVHKGFGLWHFSLLSLWTPLHKPFRNQSHEYCFILKHREDRVESARLV